MATLLGAVTLLLSGIGVYGLLAYSVARRTQEIGVRIATGAERTAVRWMVLKQSLILAGAGMALGLPAAIFGTRVVQSMLFRAHGTRPDDDGKCRHHHDRRVGRGRVPIPARRASRVDPIVALRAE